MQIFKRGKISKNISKLKFLPVQMPDIVLGLDAIKWNVRTEILYTYTKWHN